MLDRDSHQLLISCEVIRSRVLRGLISSMSNCPTGVPSWQWVSLGSSCLCRCGYSCRVAHLASAPQSHSSSASSVNKHGRSYRSRARVNRAATHRRGLNCWTKPCSRGPMVCLLVLAHGSRSRPSRRAIRPYSACLSAKVGDSFRPFAAVVPM